jgi:hypothetical protein
VVFLHIELHEDFVVVPYIVSSFPSPEKRGDEDSIYYIRNYQTPTPELVLLYEEGYYTDEYKAMRRDGSLLNTP